jgi:hypothetical protein
MKTIAEQLNITEFPFEIMNKNNNLIYYENKAGWFRTEFDKNGDQIYFQNSYGLIEDKRPRIRLTLEEIANKFKIDVTLLEIKK